MVRIMWTAGGSVKLRVFTGASAAEKWACRNLRGAYVTFRRGNVWLFVNEEARPINRGLAAELFKTAESRLPEKTDRSRTKNKKGRLSM